MSDDTLADRFIKLNKKELAQLLDIATFQRRCAQQKLERHRLEDGPMADYNPTLFYEKESEFGSAVTFWTSVEAACQETPEKEMASSPKDTREETRSRRWLAIYGAYIAAECMEYRLRTTECVDHYRMRGIMEEAEAIADLEAEAGNTEVTYERL